MVRMRGTRPLGLFKCALLATLAVFVAFVVVGCGSDPQPSGGSGYDTSGGSEYDTSGGTTYDTEGDSEYDTTGGEDYDTTGGEDHDTSGGEDYDTSGGSDSGTYEGTEYDTDDNSILDDDGGYDTSGGSDDTTGGSDYDTTGGEDYDTSGGEDYDTSGGEDYDTSGGDSDFEIVLDKWDLADEGYWDEYNRTNTLEPLLKTAYGIGDAKAYAIASRAPYGSWKDVDAVSGIGPAAIIALCEAGFHIQGDTGRAYLQEEYPDEYYEAFGGTGNEDPAGDYDTLSTR